MTHYHPDYPDYYPEWRMIFDKKGRIRMWPIIVPLAILLLSGISLDINSHPNIGNNLVVFVVGYLMIGFSLFICHQRWSTEIDDYRVALYVPLILFGLMIVTPILIIIFAYLNELEL